MVTVQEKRCLVISRALKETWVWVESVSWLTAGICLISPPKFRRRFNLCGKQR